MKITRKIGHFLIGTMLLLTLCACGSGKIETSAQTQCEEFMDVLMKGDWEGVQEQLPLDGLTSSIPEKELQNGIMQKMMNSMTYEIKSVKEQKDGNVLVTMEIENTDFKALLNALPEDISSVESARAKMIELIETTPRRCFDAEITMMTIEGQEDFDIEIDVSFANAVTGGMYEVFVELMKETMSK